MKNSQGSLPGLIWVSKILDQCLYCVICEQMHLFKKKKPLRLLIINKECIIKWTHLSLLNTNNIQIEIVLIKMKNDMAKNFGRGNDNHDIKVILTFLKFILQLWGQKLNARTESEKMCMKGKLASATYTQTQSYIGPLFKRLKNKTIHEDILEHLVHIAKYMLDRDYVKANDTYLQMAIGNAPWPIGVTMVGIHARTGREKIFSRNIAHVLNDETQRKFIQALKRLMTQCQRLFPTDPSRSVEYNA
ncbi:pre-mRNA-splicing factor 18-like isoform X2 [Centruroides sculpturatus]|uniref:pre-mRNA-splicing factor 18-like isoform X2 n=1 Tax=Centruroides sculpturatus TaxID=218467 RepID=UPI000C6CDFC1|nr:pre-mRNA-splicing factor 18-like isoform X2 [Centruroides sculpturatus]